MQGHKEEQYLDNDCGLCLATARVQSTIAPKKSPLPRQPLGNTVHACLGDLLYQQLHRKTKMEEVTSLWKHGGASFPQYPDHVTHRGFKGLGVLTG